MEQALAEGAEKTSHPEVSSPLRVLSRTLLTINSCHPNEFINLNRIATSQVIEEGETYSLRVVKDDVTQEERVVSILNGKEVTLEKDILATFTRTERFETTHLNHLIIIYNTLATEIDDLLQKKKQDLPIDSLYFDHLSTGIDSLHLLFENSGNSQLIQVAKDNKPLITSSRIEISTGINIDKLQQALKEEEEARKEAEGETKEAERKLGVAFKEIQNLVAERDARPTQTDVEAAKEKGRKEGAAETYTVVTKLANMLADLQKALKPENVEAVLKGDLSAIPESFREPLGDLLRAAEEKTSRELLGAKETGVGERIFHALLLEDSNRRIEALEKDGDPLTKAVAQALREARTQGAVEKSSEFEQARETDRRQIESLEDEVTRFTAELDDLQGQITTQKGQEDKIRAAEGFAMRFGMTVEELTERTRLVEDLFRGLSVEYQEREKALNTLMQRLLLSPISINTLQIDSPMAKKIIIAGQKEEKSLSEIIDKLQKANQLGILYRSLSQQLQARLAYGSEGSEIKALLSQIFSPTTSETRKGLTRNMTMFALKL